MEKSESSREVPKWGTLDRDILAVIFGKLHVMDLTMGPSRVCISWFLASHNKTLWNTIDLAKLQQVEEESLSLRNIFTKIKKSFSNFCVSKSLEHITKFSRTVPKNLFFNFNSYIQEEDLMFAAERMPNIEKLFLPYWYYHYNEDSVRLVFSQWKNLKTLIIAHDHYVTGLFPFQVVGESSNNLTNLKYFGYVDKNIAEVIMPLQSLKRLSFRCSIVRATGVLALIRGLKNLEILNLSHCKYLARVDDMLRYHDIPGDDVVQAASEKLDKFIICSKKDCRVCKERPSYRMRWSYDS